MTMGPSTSGSGAGSPVIQVVQDGPLLILGDLVVRTASGEEIRKSGATAFCRCGASRAKPFCDSSHHLVGFKD